MQAAEASEDRLLEARDGTEDLPLGALIAHVTGGHLDGGKGSFQPMNINYGLMPPIEVPVKDGAGKRWARNERGRAKKRMVGERALTDLAGWLA